MSRQVAVEIAKAISERALLEKVRQLARLGEWMTYHTHRSEHSEPGFPDLVLAHHRRGLWFVELKSERGKLTPHQVSWLMTLGRLPGVNAAVWRPSDIPRIEALLLKDQIVSPVPRRGGAGVQGET